ncbi:hypothetical protein [Roseateles puraquae]|uniref:NarX-like N-terminal domain-containing protein n=1 Tax=Roseateles puraquae TaxID=431059 RepID=A0A254N1G3_9BURK|nr:hypothetical protein [Roseateles puraquae]MDG0855262.1 hypothetical protein [Roseateles puraquae]MDG0855323.1 hypothetical protein [Roseateles puraquae]OWR01750.1 hypothetical protein CDO81_23590 [Roseateles puraquae]
MQSSRRHLLLSATLAALPLAGHCQAPAPCATPSLGALSQRMGKAWLCTADNRLAPTARQVLQDSQLAFQQQLVQLGRAVENPEQAGGLRALARRYEDYQTLLAGRPDADSHRALLATANEMLTLAQLASGSRAGLPWQARLAARQRLLSQRIALLGLANADAAATRRERQSAIYEFEAGQQTLREAGGSALRPFLATADAAWTPLRDAAGAGQPAPVFNASERLLAVMETVTEHCSRIT